MGRGGLAEGPRLAPVESSAHVEVGALGRVEHCASRGGAINVQLHRVHAARGR